MNLALLILEIILSTIAGYQFTKVLIQYSFKYSLLDTTNERSSHKIPTPRIGGISFVTLISLILVISYKFELYNLNANIYFALLVPPLLVASIGIIDDVKKGVPRLVRLLWQFIAVGLVFYILKIHNNDLFTIALVLIVFFGALWTINLYNFMDGIDGIATSEAIFFISVSIGFSLQHHQNDWAFLQITILGPLFGFLFLNWQPAKIFMGDIGSTYLGMLLPCILITGILMHIFTLWSGIILLGTFLTDASWTLFYRLVTKQKWYSPHRSHFYQILSRKMNSHAKVSMYNMGINICWLLPLSYLANTIPKIGRAHV